MEGWHYIPVPNLSALSWETTIKYSKDFYCLNYLHSHRTKKKVKLHKKVCENSAVLTPEKHKLLNTRGC